MKTVEEMIADFQPSPELEAQYAAWQQANRHYDRAPKLRGKVVDSERGFIDWQESFSPGDPLGEGSLPANVVTDRVEFAVTPHRKRTPAERLADVTGMLLDAILPHYHATGQVVLPHSVLREVQAIFWEQGITVTEADLQAFTESQLRELFTTYAARTLAYCERAYAANSPSYQTDLSTGRVAVKGVNK